MSWWYPKTPRWPFEPSWWPATVPLAVIRPGEALALARETQAELYAISVARGEGEIVQAEEIIHRLISAANQQGMPVQGRVPKGMQPDDAIVQEALRYKVDIIIMGSHGRTGVKKLLMGSVTERVIGQAACPVLVIKK